MIAEGSSHIKPESDILQKTQHGFFFFSANQGMKERGWNRKDLFWTKRDLTGV